MWTLRKWVLGRVQCEDPRLRISLACSYKAHGVSEVSVEMVWTHGLARRGGMLAAQ